MTCPNIFKAKNTGSGYQEQRAHLRGAEDLINASMEGETHLSHSDADKVLPSSEKKARIELGKVLFITWKSETEDSHEPDWTVIELSVPSPQEECPITQELMESPASDLEFLPGVTFQKDFPQYKRIQLKCGHAFSAMSLTYHFFKNGMLCPLCRAGQDRRLAPVCVPSHFRKKMQERLVAERAQVSLGFLGIVVCPIPRA